MGPLSEMVLFGLPVLGLVAAVVLGAVDLIRRWTSTTVWEAMWVVTALPVLLGWAVALPVFSVYTPHILRVFYLGNAAAFGISATCTATFALALSASRGLQPGGGSAWSSRGFAPVALGGAVSALALARFAVPEPEQPVFVEFVYVGLAALGLGISGIGVAFARRGAARLDGARPSVAAWMLATVLLVAGADLSVSLALRTGHALQVHLGLVAVLVVLGALAALLVHPRPVGSGLAAVVLVIGAVAFGGVQDQLWSARVDGVDLPAIRSDGFAGRNHRPCIQRDAAERPPCPDRDIVWAVPGDTPLSEVAEAEALLVGDGTGAIELRATPAPLLPVRVDRKHIRRTEEGWWLSLSGPGSFESLVMYRCRELIFAPQEEISVQELVTLCTRPGVSCAISEFR